ncbi:MAG: hypothetical protein ACRDZ4_02900 [Egibacteraceae bacterium]
MRLRSGSAVTAVALIMVLAGCSVSGGPQRKAEQQARNDAEESILKDELAKTPGMVRVSVSYSNYITSPGAAQVSLIVTHGTDFEHAADLAVGAIWRSHFDPLHFIRVDVVDDQDRTEGIERGYSIFDDLAELEAKYGPRPVGAVTRERGRG